MRIVEKARNFIESNPYAANLLSVLGRNSAYRAFVYSRIGKRIEYIKKHKCYSVIIELSSVCNARCIFCPHSAMRREKRLMGDDRVSSIVLANYPRDLTPQP